MTIEEAGRRYGIPAFIREEYEQSGLRGRPGDESGIWECGERDLEYMGLMVTLHEIGFERAEVVRYTSLVVQGAGTKAERMKMLYQKRDSTLQKIHSWEERIQALDYLRYELQK